MEGLKGDLPRVLVVEVRVECKEQYLPGVLVWMCYNGVLCWVLPSHSLQHCGVKLSHLGVSHLEEEGREKEEEEEGEEEGLVSMISSVNLPTISDALG